MEKVLCTIKTLYDTKDLKVTKKINLKVFFFVKNVKKLINRIKTRSNYLTLS